MHGGEIKLIKIEPNTKVNYNNLEKLIDIYGLRHYRFNRQLIMDDINKLKNKYNEERSKIRRRNIENLIIYLKDIYDRSEDVVNIRWVVDGVKVATIPIQFISTLAYNVMITDYMILDDNASIISVDYTDIINLIAFYMTYKAMGINLEDVEFMLNKIGITVPYDAKEVVGLINPVTYELAKILKPVLSEHVSKENRAMYTFYVNEKPRKLSKNYNEVLEDTYNITISYILENLLGLLEGKKYNNVKTAAVYSTYIYFIADEIVGEDLKAMFSDLIMLKVFGRNFEISPKVQVFRRVNIG